MAEAYVEVEPLKLEDEPDALCLLFRPINTDRVTSQMLVDALAEWCLLNDPDDFPAMNTEGAH